MWTTNPDDPRTKAALERKCPVSTCLVPPGDECKTPTGIVHQLRVPEAIVLGKEVA